MSVLVDLPKHSFDSVWNGNKTFHVLEDPQNKLDLHVGYVISFRERNNKKLLTGREIHANILYVEAFAPYYSVVGIRSYQKLDFKENPNAKRRV